MLVLIFVIFALASAGQIRPNSSPAVSSQDSTQKCSATAEGRQVWLEAQGQRNTFFSDTPDIWAYTNRLPAFDPASTELFYVAFVDYICGASRPGCTSNLVTLEQTCANGFVDVKAVLDVSNANTFIGTLNWKTYTETNVTGAQIIYGCRLNQNTKTPSTTTPESQDCGDVTEWQNWLATSSGRFSFTYRIHNGTCTCDTPTNYSNYNHDATSLADYNAAYSAANSTKRIYQQDNDVVFSGSGFFNAGAGDEWAGVAGVHQIKQLLAGQVIPCGEDCYSSNQGSMNINLNPVGGDYLSLRQFLKGLFSPPGLPLSNKPNPHKSAKPTRSPK